MSGVVTMDQVNARLIDLSKQLDEATDALIQAEHDYPLAKADYEIATSAARMREQSRAQDKGVKVTVQYVEDAAILATAEQLRRLYVCEGIVRACRANARRLETQVEITRSVGSNSRTATNL